MENQVFVQATKTHTPPPPRVTYRCARNTPIQLESRSYRGIFQVNPAHTAAVTCDQGDTARTADCSAKPKGSIC